MPFASRYTGPRFKAISKQNCFGGYVGALKNSGAACACPRGPRLHHGSAIQDAKAFNGQTRGKTPEHLTLEMLAST